MKTKRKILSGVIGLMYAACTAIVPVCAEETTTPTAATTDTMTTTTAVGTTTDATTTTTAVVATTDATATTQDATSKTEAKSTDETTVPPPDDNKLNPNASAIKKYFAGLKYDGNGLLTTNLVSNEETRMEYTINPNGDMVVTYYKKEPEEFTYDTFSVIDFGDVDPNIFPGSMLKANKMLITGEPEPVMLPRAKTALSIPNVKMKEGSKNTATYTPNHMSDAQNAINSITENITEVPSQASLRIEKIDSLEQLSAKLNISESFWGKMNLDFSYASKQHHQYYVAELDQVYYTVAADNVYPYEAFAEDVTVEDIKEEIEVDGDPKNLEPPVYVSSVTYGRKVLVVADCDDTSMQLKAELQAALSGIASGDVSVDYDELNKHCSLKVLTLGGTSQDAGKFMTMDFAKLSQAFADTTKYKGGSAIPLSFKTLYLKDQKPAQSHYIGDTWTTVTEVRNGFDLDVIMGSVAKKLSPSANLNVKILGKKVKDMDENGQLTYNTQEEVIQDITVSDPTTIHYTIPGDVLPGSIKFQVLYWDAKPSHNTSFTLPLYLMDTTISNDIPKTKKIELKVNGHEEEQYIYETLGISFEPKDKNGENIGKGNYYLAGVDAIIYCSNGEDHYVSVSDDRGYTSSIALSDFNNGANLLLTPETIPTTEPANTTTTEPVNTTTTEAAKTTTTEPVNTVTTEPANTTTTEPVNTTTTETISTTTSESSTEATTQFTTTDKQDGWYASLKQFAEMALNDYEKKTGKRPTNVAADVDENGKVVINICDASDDGLMTVAYYTVDPKTGIGVDENGEPVNLPQTGNNSPETAAAAGLAILMIAAGCFTVMKCGILRKKEQ